MKVSVKIFIVLFWFACAVALLLVTKENNLVRDDAGQTDGAVETTVEESDVESARYMKHVILALFAFVPTLGVCAAFIGSRSSAKKGEEEKEAEPVFKGTVKSVSIEEKVKQPSTT